MLPLTKQMSKPKVQEVGTFLNTSVKMLWEQNWNTSICQAVRGEVRWETTAWPWKFSCRKLRSFVFWEWGRWDAESWAGVFKATYWGERLGRNPYVLTLLCRLGHQIIPISTAEGMQDFRSRPVSLGVGISAAGARTAALQVKSVKFSYSLQVDSDK